MRRRVWFWARLALICVVLMASLAAAGAEEDAALRIRVVARPEGLIEPGDVMLNFTIENVSDAEVGNVYISSADGLISELVGQVPSGESVSFSRQHSVTAQELDLGEIVYTVSHDDPEDPNIKVNYSVHAQIHRGDAVPDVEFTRQFSSRAVEAGDTVTVTYRLRNTGNVPLTELLVVDSLGGFTGRVELLEVGETRTLINRASVSGSSASSASLSYRGAQDGEPHTLVLEDVPVRVASASMSAAFNADHNAFSGNVANVVLTLRNDGDVGYRDICVIDDLYGGVIADELTLPVGGEPLEVSRAYDLRGEQGFRWRVTAVSESGQQLDLVTETLHISPAQSGSSDALRVSAQPLMPRIRRAGNVWLRVRIDNSGGVDLRDLVLSEASRGEMHEFAVLGADGSIERDFSFYVDDDASFSFQLIGATAAGEAVIAQAEPVEVKIDPDGELPEGARDTLVDFTGGSIKIGGSSTFAMLLLGGLTLLLALSVALIIVSHRTKRAERARADARADKEKRRREEWGKTRKLPTVRGASKPRGRGKDPQP